MKKIILFFGLVFLFSCVAGEYQQVNVLPDYVKNIYIKTFSNATTFYGLEQKMTQDLINEFLDEGRLGIAASSDTADAILEGEITRYNLEPLRYDANEVVQEYQLSMDVTFTFKDKSGKLLYKEENLHYDINYYPPGSNIDGVDIETENEAQDRLIKEIVKEIVELITKWR